MLQIKHQGTNAKSQEKQDCLSHNAGFSTTTTTGPHAENETEAFLRTDTCALNAIATIKCLHNEAPLFITGGMDGYIRLFDCVEGTLRAEFDAGHVDPQLGTHGNPVRLPVLAMASNPDQNLIATGDSLGKIRTFDITSVTNEVISLSFDVIEAAELVAADANGFSDPYVKLVFKAGPAARPQQAKTEVICENLNPVWNQHFNFLVGIGQRHEIMKHHWKVEMHVMDYDKYSGDDDLGSASLDIHNLSFEHEETRWLNLIDPDPPEGGLPRPHGKICVRACLHVQFAKPDVFAEWQAHDEAIISLDLSHTSEANSDTGRMPLIVSVSAAESVKVWTMAGVPIGAFGHGMWSPKEISLAQDAGIMKRAESLMRYQKMHEDLLVLEEKERQAQLKSDAVLDDLKEEMEAREEDLQRKLANDRVKEYIRRLESSDDVNDRVKAVSFKSGIPDETYDGENCLRR